MGDVLVDFSKTGMKKEEADKSVAAIRHIA